MPIPSLVNFISFWKAHAKCESARAPNGSQRRQRSTFPKERRTVCAPKIRVLNFCWCFPKATDRKSRRSGSRNERPSVQQVLSEENAMRVFQKISFGLDIRQLLRRTAAIVVLGVGLGVTFSAVAVAEDLNKLLPDDIRQAGEIHVAANASYPPFSFRSENGESTGLEPTIVRALADKLGIKATFTAVDFATVMPSITAGRFDLGVAGYNNTEE